MSATQITPGPWEAVEWTCHAKTTIKAGNVVVAECSGFGRMSDDSLADARLIASCPEMLAVLQAFVRAADGRRIQGHLILDPRSSLVIAAKDVLEKATGFPDGYIPQDNAQPEGGAA